MCCKGGISVYKIDTNETLKEIIEHSIELLLKNDIPISTNIYFKEGNATKCYGTCEKLKPNKIKDFEFKITISKHLMNNSEIENTVVHELLHTIPNCCPAHNEKWKHFAKVCSKLINSEITVSGNKQIDPRIIKQKRKIYDIAEYDSTIMNIATYPRCHQEICITKNIKGYSDGSSKYACNKCNKPYFYKLPSSIFQAMNDNERHQQIELILKGNIPQNFNLTQQDCCYLSQEECDRIWLFLRNNYPRYFLKFEVKAFWDIEKYISKEAIRKHVNDLISGQFDNLKMTYAEWIYFSRVFCLTKEYSVCNDYYKQKLMIN